YCISFPDFTFSDETGPEKEAPLQEQVLMLHYLLAPNPSAGPENWIAYREIPGASFYFAAFGKRAIDPLKKAFGQNISGLAASAGRLGGRSIRTGDAGFTFHVFPHVPVQLILWQGDDEFAPEANILFDKSIGEILLPEDIAWLSGMLVYRLISS
ncbi:MAG: DUF3786 domain-containing protein, partial [Desulfobacterales bacterium]|nr:DUF3786 domain-containing protein [Desulfobacterales bacterium]